MLYRGEIDAGFLGGRGFGSRLSLPLSSSSFFFPLSALGAGSGSLLCFLRLCSQDRASTRQVRAASCHVSCLSLSCLSCLSARAGLPLPLPRPFSFSFSLSLSLLFLHASVIRESGDKPYQYGASMSCNWNELAPNMLVSINWRASLVPAAAVIPAPIAYFELLRLKCWNLCCAWLYGTRLSTITLRKLECFKQAHDFGPRSME